MYQTKMHKILILIILPTIALCFFSKGLQADSNNSPNPNSGISSCRVNPNLPFCNREGYQEG